MSQSVELTYITIDYLCPSDSGKTQSWTVHAKEGGFQIGLIKWFSRWRKYAFFPCKDTVFEEKCLREIASYIELQTHVHRGVNKATKVPRRA